MIASGKKSTRQLAYASLMILLGAFLAAFSIEIFLVPNEIIDGGVIGISILIGKLVGDSVVYPLVVVLNIPFVFLAAKHISKSLVIQMIFAIVAFAVFGHFIGHSNIPMFAPYRGDLLEIVVMGGLTLGFGVGLIIRFGGCLDGTEILGLMINKKFGVSVGNVVLASNTLIFAVAGFVFEDWHPPIQSLITFFVVIKIMDMVIMGIDEMKSVMIFSSKPKVIADILMHELGLGLTFIKGKGGFSGEEKDILYLMAERLQLAEIKSLVHNEDPSAFIAIENLHEVATNNLKSIANKVVPSK